MGKLSLVFFLGYIVNEGRLLYYLKPDIENIVEKIIFIIEKLGLLFLIFNIIIYLIIGWIIGNWARPELPSVNLFLIYSFLIGHFVGAMPGKVLGSQWVLLIGLLYNWNQDIMQITLASSLSILLLFRNFKNAFSLFIIGIMSIAITLKSVFHAIFVIILVSIFLKEHFKHWKIVKIYFKKEEINRLNF